jgi:transcriptional regulator with XRE-family HTH domain
MTDGPSQPALGDALRAERRRRRMSLRDLADEIGVSFNTLSRVERGHLPDLTNYNRIVTWLSSPGLALVDDDEGEAPSTPERLAKHLYTDPRLKPEHANQMMALIQEMYERLATPRPAFAVHLRSGQTFLPEVGNLLASALEDMHAALVEEDD